jgi:hypothetical protein
MRHGRRCACGPLHSQGTLGYARMHFFHTNRGHRNVLFINSFCTPSIVFTIKKNAEFSPPPRFRFFTRLTSSTCVVGIFEGVWRPHFGRFSVDRRPASWPHAARQPGRQFAARIQVACQGGTEECSQTKLLLTNHVFSQDAILQQIATIFACSEENIGLTAAILQILSPGDTQGAAASPADMLRGPGAVVAIRGTEVS